MKSQGSAQERIQQFKSSLLKRGRPSPLVAPPAAPTSRQAETALPSELTTERTEPQAANVIPVAKRRLEASKYKPRSTVGEQETFSQEDLELEPPPHAVPSAIRNLRKRTAPAGASNLRKRARVEGERADERASRGSERGLSDHAGPGSTISRVLALSRRLGIFNKSRQSVVLTRGELRGDQCVMSCILTG